MRLLNIVIKYIYSLLVPTPEDRLRRKLIDMRWFDFEEYTADMFGRFGYSHVRRTGRDGPDGGKDVVIEHGDKRYLVQCKHWTKEPVGITLLREFYAVLLENGANGGYFVTLAGYTQPARAYARNKEIRLVSMTTLIYWEKLHRLGNMSLDRIEINNPCAPRCKSGVLKVRRNSQRGPFWGCGEWPDCYCKANRVGS